MDVTVAPWASWSLSRLIDSAPDRADAPGDYRRTRLYSDPTTTRKLRLPGRSARQVQQVEEIEPENKMRTSAMGKLRALAPPGS